MIFAMSIPAFAGENADLRDLTYEQIYKAPIVENVDNFASSSSQQAYEVKFNDNFDNEDVSVLKYKITDKSNRKISSIRIDAVSDSHPVLDGMIKVKANGTILSPSIDGKKMNFSFQPVDTIEVHFIGKNIAKGSQYTFYIEDIEVSQGASVIDFDESSKWIDNGGKYLLKASFTNFNNAVVKVDINGTETDITNGHDGFGTIKKELSRYLFKDGKNSCKLIVIADNGELSEYKFTVTAPNSSGDTGNDDTGNDDTGNDDSGNSGNTGSGILSINFNKSEMFTTSNMILASFMGLLTVIVGIAIGFRVVRFIKDLF